MPSTALTRFNEALPAERTEEALQPVSIKFRPSPERSASRWKNRESISVGKSLSTLAGGGSASALKCRLGRSASVRPEGEPFIPRPISITGEALGFGLFQREALRLVEAEGSASVVPAGEAPSLG